MKLASYLSLAALLSISSCSMMNKSCCAKKEAVSCSKEKEDCKKACADKDIKCADGSCAKEEKKEDSKGDHCKKK